MLLNFPPLLLLAYWWLVDLGELQAGSLQVLDFSAKGLLALGVSTWQFFPKTNSFDFMSPILGKPKDWNIKEESFSLIETLSGCSIILSSW